MGSVSIEMYLITTAQQNADGTWHTECLTVNLVLPGGNSEKAGFKKGDFIRTFQGEKLDSQYQLFDRKGMYRPGARVKAEVERDGKIIELTWILGEDKDREVPEV